MRRVEASRGGLVSQSILLFSPSTNTRDSLSFGRSMGIRFACHECGKRLNIKSELAGRRGVCPACSAKMRIPLSDAETSTPVEEILPFPQADAPAGRRIHRLRSANMSRRRPGTFVRPAGDSTAPLRRNCCVSGLRKDVLPQPRSCGETAGRSGGPLPKRCPNWLDDCQVSRLLDRSSSASAATTPCDRSVATAHRCRRTALPPRRLPPRRWARNPWRLER